MCKLDSENEEGTRDQIAKICCIIVKAWEFQKIYTFASLATLKPLIVWTTTNCRKFLEMELPDHLTCFPRNLYTGQIATVKITWNNGIPQNLEGVQQGCIPSPCLFNSYAEYIMRNAGWMDHKLESRLPKEILTTSYMQIITL